MRFLLFAAEQAAALLGRFESTSAPRLELALAGQEAGRSTLIVGWLNSLARPWMAWPNSWASTTPTADSPSSSTRLGISSLSSYTTKSPSLQ